MPTESLHIITKAVANTGLCDYIHRSVRTLLDLGTKLTYIDAEQLCVAEVFSSPDLVEECSMRDQFACI
jgi:hypothetical protein